MLQLSLPRGGAVPHLHHHLQGPLQHWLPSYLFGNKLKLTTFLNIEGGKSVTIKNNISPRTNFRNVGVLRKEMIH